MYSDVEDHLVGLKEPLGRVVFEWHESDIVDYIKVFTHKKNKKIFELLAASHLYRYEKVAENQCHYYGLFSATVTESCVLA